MCPKDANILPICRKSMDSVDIVHGHCQAEVLECGSVDNVHWVHGQCARNQWTMSTESMDNVHSVHGQCPLRPWTMSTESMDNVHSVHGLFPWVFPTLYLVKNYSNPTKLNAYIQFTMHVIYISWHTMPICPSILIKHTVCLSRSHKKLHCFFFIYCDVVSLFIIFRKIITNWGSKCCC